jgi:hypothetical protein
MAWHRERRMDIFLACTTIRAWSDQLARHAPAPIAPGNLPDAVAELKRYLEHAKCDGKPIRALESAEFLLATREGVGSVMPFVQSAEAMEAWKRMRRDSPR